MRKGPSPRPGGSFHFQYFLDGGRVNGGMAGRTVAAGSGWALAAFSRAASSCTFAIL